MMDHRLIKMGKTIILIISTIMVAFGTSGCASRYYRGDYPELFTVAMNSLLGITGVRPSLIGDPEITILGNDSYGRTLFMYDEGGLLGISILISQKSDGRYVYFYPHYNFIIFETFSEMTSWAGTRSEVRIDRFFPEVIEQIDELKEMNHWNQELNLENSVRREIAIKNNHFRKGPVRDDRLIELYNIALGDDAWRNPLTFHIKFLTTDDYGRSVYLGISNNLSTEDEDTRTERLRYVVMFFQPDGSFDEVKGVMELEDMLHYQTVLREFKELNGWNQPFEDTTTIPKWWLVVGAVIIAGAGGFVVIAVVKKRKTGSHITTTAYQKIKRLKGLLLETLKSHRMRRKEGEFTLLGSGKKRIFSLLYMIMPGILVSSSFYFSMRPLFWYYVIFVYLTTLIGIILVSKFNPCRFDVLIIGLLISPFSVLVYIIPEIPGLIGGYYNPFLLLFAAPVVAIYGFMYALPFAVVALVIRRIKGNKSLGKRED